MKMPKQKPHESVQVVQTDPLLIKAVKRRWGRIDVDLAASDENAQAYSYITEEDDAFSYDWGERDFAKKVMWLNPPFSKIEPWAKKCAATSLALLKNKSKIIMLTPASVSSNWFANHVWGRAKVIALQGRLTFVGHTTSFPKDCILSVYGPTIPSLADFEVWDWRKDAL